MIAFTPLQEHKHIKNCRQIIIILHLYSNLLFKTVARQRGYVRAASQAGVVVDGGDVIRATYGVITSVALAASIT